MIQDKVANQDAMFLAQDTENPLVAGSQGGAYRVDFRRNVMGSPPALSFAAGVNKIEYRLFGDRHLRCPASQNHALKVPMFRNPLRRIEIALSELVQAPSQVRKT